MTQRIAMLSAVIVVVTMAIIWGAAAAPLDLGSERLIHSTGTGNVIGTPDRAQISLTVQTENPDVRTAQRENAVKMGQVIDSLVAAGIPKDALKTTGYTIYPVYDDAKLYSGDTSGQKIQTYRVSNTLTITLHDVNRVGEVIDIGVANGINQAGSIQFLLSDEQAQVLRTEALKEAVSRARADADTVSSALGVRITGVGDAVISGGYMPVIYDNYQIAGEMKAAAPTPIQPGDITVSATVSVAYLIR